MGFATKGPLGKVNVQRLQEFYTQTLDDAMMDIVSGAFSYNTVLERTINTMTKSGLRSVDYATGHSNRIEVAVRRALMTGYSQVQRYNAEQVAAELGTDYFEVSAHGGARPSHAEWQGRVYSRAELYSVCGLDTAAGLLGINCYHSYDPFIPGISVRRYSDDDLDRIREEDARPREYDGKSYNKYEALQHQRKLETTLRKYRRDVHLLEKGGADPDTILNKKIKYQVTYGQYKNFSKAMELPMQRARIYQDGLDVNMYAKRVAKPGKSAIIVTREAGPIQMNLQLFAEEKGLSKQTDKNLKKGIKSLEEEIAKHEKKIQNPAAIYEDWDQVPEIVRQGRLEHWRKEIRAFEKGGSDRRVELKRRKKE